MVVLDVVLPGYTSRAYTDMKPWRRQAVSTEELCKLGTTKEEVAPVAPGLLTEDLDYAGRWKRWAADIEFRLAAFDADVSAKAEPVEEVLDPDHTQRSAVETEVAQAFQLRIPTLAPHLFQLSPERGQTTQCPVECSADAEHPAHADQFDTDGVQADLFQEDFSFACAGPEEDKFGEQGPMEPCWESESEGQLLAVSAVSAVSAVALKAPLEPLPAWHFDSLRGDGMDKFQRASAWSRQRELSLCRLNSVLQASPASPSPSPSLNSPKPPCRGDVHDVEARSKQWLEAKRAREHQLREQQQEMELRECTFQPRLEGFQAKPTEATITGPREPTRGMLRSARSARSLYDRQQRWHQALLEKRDRQRQRRADESVPPISRRDPRDVDAAFEQFHERNRRWQSLRQVQRRQQQKAGFCPEANCQGCSPRRTAGPL